MADVPVLLPISNMLFGVTVCGDLSVGSSEPKSSH